MKRKSIAIIALSLCLIFALVLPGCFGTPKSTTATPSVTDRITAVEKSVVAQDKTIATLSGKIDSLPSSGQVSDAVNAANNAKSEVSNLKEEVAALKTTVTSLQSRIADLENDNSNNNNNDDDDDNNNNSSGDGEQVASNKDLKLYLTDISPSMDSLIVSGNSSQNLRMDFEVENKDNSSHTYEIRVYLYPTKKATQYGALETDTDLFSDTTIELDGIEPNPFPAVDSMTPIVIYLVNGWVGKSDTTEFTLSTNIKKNSAGSVQFDYDYNIRQTN